MIIEIVFSKITSYFLQEMAQEELINFGDKDREDILAVREGVREILLAVQEFAKQNPELLKEAIYENIMGAIVTKNIFDGQPIGKEETRKAIEFLIYLDVFVIGEQSGNAELLSRFEELYPKINKLELGEFYGSDFEN